MFRHVEKFAPRGKHSGRGRKWDAGEAEHRRKSQQRAYNDPVVPFTLLASQEAKRGRYSLKRARKKSGETRKKNEKRGRTLYLTLGIGSARLTLEKGALLERVCEGSRCKRSYALSKKSSRAPTAVANWATLCADKVSMEGRVSPKYAKAS